MKLIPNFISLAAEILAGKDDKRDSEEFMAERYRTRQREEILNYLEANSGAHLTPDAIAGALPGVGRSTVYRTLERLEQEGSVRRFAGEAGRSACFQYVGEAGPCHEHFHLKCLVCGKLIHLDCEKLTECQVHILKEHGFATDLTRTLIYGRCLECSRKEKP